MKDHLIRIAFGLSFGTLAIILLVALFPTAIPLDIFLSLIVFAITIQIV